MTSACAGALKLGHNRGFKGFGGMTEVVPSQNTGAYSTPQLSDGTMTFVTLPLRYHPLTIAEG